MLPLNCNVELVFGCNNKCVFCFKQVLNKKDYEFMNYDLARVISKKLNNNINIIKFSLRGEPLLNKDIINIIKIFREYNNDSILVLYTNGKLLNNVLCDKLFDNGLNYIFLDCYDNSKNDNIIKYNNYNLIDYYDDDFNIYDDGNVNDNKIILVDDLLIRNEDKDDRIIHNHAGNINYEYNNIEPLNKSLNKVCLRPFRDLNILYNGNVVLCCDDSGEDCLLGNIINDDVIDLFNCDKIKYIRRELLMKNRKNVNPCYKCDYKESINNLV